jgi:hypothetical protein
MRKPLGAAVFFVGAVVAVSFFAAPHPLAASTQASTGTKRRIGASLETGGAGRSARPSYDQRELRPST